MSVSFKIVNLCEQLIFFSLLQIFVILHQQLSMFFQINQINDVSGHEVETTTGGCLCSLKSFDFTLKCVGVLPGLHCDRQGQFHYHTTKATIF